MSILPRPSIRSPPRLRRARSSACRAGGLRGDEPGRRSGRPHPAGRPRHHDGRRRSRGPRRWRSRATASSTWATRRAWTPIEDRTPGSSISTAPRPCPASPTRMLTSWARGELKARVDVLGRRRTRQVLDAVAAAVARAEPGEWIVGRGWHQEKWTDDTGSDGPGLPDQRRAEPDRARQPGLHPARVGPRPPGQPAGARGGGHHGRDAGSARWRDPPSTGRPALGHADRERRRPRRRRLPGLPGLPRPGRAAGGRAPRPPGRDRRVPAQRDHGSSHAAVASPRRAPRSQEIALYRDAHESGELRMRVWAMVGNADATDESLDTLWAIGTAGGGDGRLTVRAIKAYADGALGSRGALLLEPYADDDSRGEEVSTRGRARARGGAGAAAWLAGRPSTRSATRRTGGRSTSTQAAFAPAPARRRGTRGSGSSTRRCWPPPTSHVSRELGVTAAMQGVQATSDGPWTPTRLGPERSRERAYAFRDLWDAGALIVGGTDSPVERVNPWASMAGHGDRPDGERRGVQSRSTADAPGDARDLHDQPGESGVRRRPREGASRSASSPT